MRAARPDDEPFLREMLYAALFVPPGAAPFPRAVLAEPAIARYVEGFGRAGDRGVVAEDADGRAIGAAWVRRFTAEAPGYGFVDAATPELTVAVIPARRGAGVGAAMLAALLHDVGRCSLSVDQRNAATHLYRRLGFDVVRRDGHSLTMLRVG
ncbi:MAG TPA: GNAT family N-acetyltransferase [Ilumatobacteraceae bacterium]|nr:GNAT family N-acetyltransferase [Ilumatobacteraceae bacterium]